MPRSTTAVLRTAIYGAQTSEVFIVLLTIDHASLSSTLRFTSDAVDTVHNGNTYIPFRFDIALPDDTDDSIPQTRLIIENVDRQIVEAIRTIDGAPDVSMWIVLGSDPNTVQAGPFDMMLRNVSYDKLFVEGDLQGPNILSEPWPAHTYSASDYPDLYS